MPPRCRVKKREEQRLEAAQMTFFKHLLGITIPDKEKNECIRGKNGSTEHNKGNKKQSRYRPGVAQRVPGN